MDTDEVVPGDEREADISPAGAVEPLLQSPVPAVPDAVTIAHEFSMQPTNSEPCRYRKLFTP